MIIYVNQVKMVLLPRVCFLVSTLWCFVFSGFASVLFFPGEGDVENPLELLACLVFTCANSHGVPGSVRDYHILGLLSCGLGEVRKHDKLLVLGRFHDAVRRVHLMSCSQSMLGLYKDNTGRLGCHGHRDIKQWRNRDVLGYTDRVRSV